jgi:hypothetical protein
VHTDFGFFLTGWTCSSAPYAAFNHSPAAAKELIVLPGVNSLSSWLVLALPLVVMLLCC